MSVFEIFQGHALTVLQEQLRDVVVHTVVTSPPYYKKRHYGDGENEIGWGTISEYLMAMVGVINAVNLHPRGSVWVNLGDTRNSDGSLCFIPERFAITMMDQGWKLVDHVTWTKIDDLDDGSTGGCCMTEPAPGRLNGNGSEALYRFVRVKKKISEAWTDTCAVRIPRQELLEKSKDTRYLPSELMSVVTSIEGRNLHNCWRVGMGQTRKRHYAVYPPALVERPLAMTCPPRICSSCGNPWERHFEMEEYDEGRNRSKRIFGKYTADKDELVKKSGRMDAGRTYIPRKPVTKRWIPTCECNGDVEPGVVLDPFMGSGTTGEVALKMGRKFIGIDLYENHCKMSQERCGEPMEYLSSIGMDPFTNQYYK